MTELSQAKEQELAARLVSDVRSRIYWRLERDDLRPGAGVPVSLAELEAVMLLVSTLSGMPDMTMDGGIMFLGQSLFVTKCQHASRFRRGCWLALKEKDELEPTSPGETDTP